jgi:hypothetical protein
MNGGSGQCSVCTITKHRKTERKDQSKERTDVSNKGKEEERTKEKDEE